MPRPNGGTTLNLLENMRAQTITAELADGDQVQILVNQAPQWRGMGDGVHYYLPVGPDNRFIAEPGQRHRKIYVTASGAAMDKTAIAAHATTAGEATTASQVTAAWLTARPIYGGSEGMPLTFAVGREILVHLNGRGKLSRSDWFLMERGYEYADTGSLWQQYWRGEDELHPLVFGAWGTGTRPRVIAGISSTTPGVKNVIYRDLAPVIFYPRNTMNVVAENILMTRDEERDVHEHTIRDIRYVTYREMKIVDVWRARPGNGRLQYEDSGDRSSGLYAPSPWNFLMDGCILDHNGHGVGARADRIFDPDNPTPMPPNTKSHNRYDSYGVNDNTVRNMISARSGNTGTQGRGGGQYEGCVWLDNQVNCSISYGDQADRPSASFAINYDNINMSAGKRPTPFGGANSNGYDLFGYRHSAVDCILAHAADPNNPAEIAEKGTARRALIDWPFKFNNTIVFNWIPGQDENAGNVDPTLANQTTAQLYASTVLGAPGTMDGFLRHFRDESVNIGETVKAFVKWTQSRFGITRTTRTAAADVTFIPDARMDGFRWDNRHNWSTKELPGLHPNDTVNLVGNFVRFGTLECSLAALTTGGGVLPFEVTSGRLTVGTVTDASSIKVRHSGQFYCGATTAPLSIHSTSGRARFTGAISNLDLLADGHGQVLFGANVTAREIVISGQLPKVGWDGTGTAALTITEKLEFKAGVELVVGSTDYKYKEVVTGHPVVGDGWSGTLARI